MLFGESLRRCSTYQRSGNLGCWLSINLGLPGSGFSLGKVRHPVLTFLLRRLLWMVVTLWVVFTVSFFLMRSVPGGPYSGERKVSAEVERNLKRYYQLDKPLYQQYLIHLGSTAIGQMGPSYRLADYSVAEVIAEGFPVSASLGIFALAFAIILGLFAGIFSALYRRTGLDVGVMAAATLGMAIPNFVFASLCVVVFVFNLQLLPAAGWGTLEQVVLPALCLGLPYAAYIARLTRTGLLDVLGQDYIRTARAKGLSPRQVMTRHALKGAMVPVVSFLGPAVAGILTGSLVLEQIFAIPGLGWHFINAATTRDYTLAMGLVLTYTVLLYLMNTLVDISYAYFDPRVQIK